MVVLNARALTPGKKDGRVKMPYRSRIACRRTPKNVESVVTTCIAERLSRWSCLVPDEPIVCGEAARKNSDHTGERYAAFRPAVDAGSYGAMVAVMPVSLKPALASCGEFLALLPRICESVASHNGLLTVVW